MASDREKRLLQEIAALSERLAEDRMYEFVAEELHNNELDPAARMRALEEAEGDQNKADALYAKHRIRRLKDLATEQAIAEADAKRRREAAERANEEERGTQQYFIEQVRGGTAPKSFKKRYKNEFDAFRKWWVPQEHHRKYLTKEQVWHAFAKHKLGL